MSRPLYACNVYFVLIIKTFILLYSLSQSDWIGVQSGVLQGSVLGPLLFILYVNDVPDLIESNLKMFADDTKIYSVIKSFHDSLKLQHDINKLMQWSSVWLLRFNAAKCKVMRIGNSLPSERGEGPWSVVR